MHAIVVFLLYANAVWDLLSAAAIALNCNAIARWHTDLWTDEENRTNPAARTLMGWLLVALGLARLAAAIDPSVYLACGIVSYVLEGWFALLSTSSNAMKQFEGTVVALGSFGLAGLMII